MKKSFFLLFYIKRTRLNADGTVPVYMRITVSGERIEISCKRCVNPDKWNSGAQKQYGSTEDAKSLNNHLKDLELEVYEAYHALVSRKIPVTTAGIKALLSGEGELSARNMLVPIFAQHNKQVEALVGREYAQGTLNRYVTSLKHTQEFLQWKYKVQDIDIKRIDHDFIMSYDFYLRSERKCNNNSTVKYLKNFKKIILICNGWLDRDPFIKYKPRVKEVKRDYLTSEELAAMAAKQLVSDRTCQVRDIFLFSCYTGLAYADVKKLKRSEVVTGIDGQQWIYTSRQKTDTASRIPVLPQALALLAR